jgi:hypothetical protein
MVPECSICHIKLVNIDDKGKRVNTIYKVCKLCNEIWCKECTEQSGFTNLKCIIKYTLECECEPPCDCKFSPAEIIRDKHKLANTSFN